MNWKKPALSLKTEEFLMVFSLLYVVSKGGKENMDSVLFLNALNNKKISNYR